MLEDFSDLFIADLSKVENILLKQGYKVDTSELSPPNKKDAWGQKRVLAIRKKLDSLEIIWSYENYS